MASHLPTWVIVVFFLVIFVWERGCIDMISTIHIFVVYTYHSTPRTANHLTEVIDLFNANKDQSTVLYYQKKY